ncbi:MAG: L,D-transpeptidase [Proteobacteria bacterium]|nr:L,D-transpeptidase [Pseudomonadota bacterium]
MKKHLVHCMVVVSLLLGLCQVTEARYASRYCSEPGFTCMKVRGGDTWYSSFPDIKQRDVVMRLNRMNTRLYPGLVIAVPKNLRGTDAYAISPFPSQMNTNGQKMVIVNQDELAWGAYNEAGHLVWWGPISSGEDYCPDIHRGCHSPTGNYHFFRKQGADCISSKFPIETDGGAPMPYCMHFNGGYALHGSFEVPGYRASHGCIRLFSEDARWLNQEFIDLPGNGRGQGTAVIIQPI